jgi:hypothetical protein
VKRRALAMIVVVAIGGALALVPGAGARDAWTLRFGFVPQRAYQGRAAALTVLVRSPKARCTLAIRYVDGSRQAGLGKAKPVNGRVSWTWDVAATVPAGAARAAVSCGKVGRLARSFVVVGGTAVFSKLTVAGSGWSQRPDVGTPGSTVSYGVQVENPSDTQDAKNVTVLVNAIDSAGHVQGTATTAIPLVGAASLFNVGGTVHVPTVTPISRLEIVVQVASHVKHELHEPAVENVHVVPSAYQPAWVGSVDGEIVNDDVGAKLTSAKLSIVIFDSTGKIVGGGTGYVFATLPPGTRSFFSGAVGLAPIPTAEASTAAVSVEPTYTPTG